MATLIQPFEVQRYWKYALALAFFTIFYNIFEGLVSISFGVSDESLALFGDRKSVV